MTKMLFTTAFLLLSPLFLAGRSSGLAVYDPTTRCADLPAGLDSDQICLTEFEYYWIPEYFSDSVKGWQWIYNAWKETEDSTEFVGTRVAVYLGLDEETCDIGLGGSYGGSNSISCRSCTFCEFRGSGPDERDNAAFKADCTNIPGGRMIDNCESTFPFFYPVDFFDPLYGTTGAPTVASPSEAPSPEPLPDYCEGDQVFDPCGNTCPAACNNNIPIPSDDVFICIYDTCVPGCFCPPDKPVALGDGSGTCLTSRDECPRAPTTAPTVKDGTFYPTSEVTYSGTLCPGELVFITCGGTCPYPTCAAGVETGTPCSDECISGCYCPLDKPLRVDGTNDCVATLAECPDVRETESPTIAPTTESSSSLSSVGPSSTLGPSIVPSHVMPTSEPTMESTPALSGGPSIVPSAVLPTSAPTMESTSSLSSSGPSSTLGPSIVPSVVMPTSVPTTESTPAVSGGPSIVPSIVVSDPLPTAAPAPTKSPSLATTPGPSSETRLIMHEFKAQVSITLRGRTDEQLTPTDVDVLLEKLEEFYNTVLEEDIPGVSVDLILEEYENPLDSELILTDFTTHVMFEGSSMTERQVIYTLAEANYSQFIHRYLLSRSNGVDGIFKKTFKVQYKAFGKDGP